MPVLFLMPQWEATSEVWMRRMIDGLLADLSGIVVNNSQGNSNYANIPVVSLNTGPHEIKYLSRIFLKFGLSVTRAQEKPHQVLHKVLNNSETTHVLCQYGTFAFKFLDIWDKNDLPLYIHFHGYDATFNLRKYDQPGILNHEPEYQSAIVELQKKAIFIANSNFTRSLLLNAGIGPDRVKVKYYGVPIPPSAHVYKKSDSIRILHLGRLIDFKSPDRTIKAFEIAKSKGLKGDLIIAGDGPLRSYCEILRIRSPYKDSIQIVGSVSPSQAQTYFELADIFTQHNIQGEISMQSECLGVSILEAMANGTPVVGTRNGGVLETVVNGETGFLVEPGDVEAQADAFLKLANNPDLRQQMGDAGRNRVATHFSPQQETERLREIMGLPSKGGER
ncbi:MAG TPA: hypothetical protein DCY35_04705 [Prolixibacteraceae bacterium]|nr:hypothetical protein [Prolixibacteraceae bacterium]